VRLESPGRDWEVAQLLLAAGARESGDQEYDWLALPYRKGWLVRPGLLYTGFHQVLQGLRASFDARPHLVPLACPLQLAEMFDKNATCDRLAAAGIPVPPFLPPSFIQQDPPELLAELRRRRWPTAYAKLNTGSSASAIAVVRAAEEPWAVSSIVQLEGQFYSSRRLGRHAGADLDAVLAFLLREGVCVQQGIRMATIDGLNFDVRVVLLRGRVAFTIFRLSSEPMTNLHLGGRRGEVPACRACIPMRAWLDALDHCTEAAALYDAEVVGVDLLFESGYLRHFLLEVNAFGDFFPGLVDERGHSVHRAELEATAELLGWK
jgi:hypothetical protein